MSNGEFWHFTKQKLFQHKTQKKMEKNLSESAKSIQVFFQITLKNFSNNNNQNNNNNNNQSDVQTAYNVLANNSLKMAKNLEEFKQVIKK